MDNSIIKTPAPIFDYKFYLNEAKLENYSFHEALFHFYHYGKERGLRGSPLCSRENFIKYLKTLNASSILEIGPAGAPIFRGEKVRYFDVLDKEGIKEWCKLNNISASNMPETIHFYSPKADMSVISGTYKLIFSAHNIEHQIDLIDHINKTAELLEPDGMFACIAPDKRYCFDHYRHLSTLADVMIQHESPSVPQGHPLSAYIDRHMSNTHNKSIRHWAGDHGIVNFDFKRLLDGIDFYRASTSYIDLHRWTFNSDSFYEIFNTLFRSHIIKLKPIRVYNTPLNTFEFCSLFVKTANS